MNKKMFVGAAIVLSLIVAFFIASSMRTNYDEVTKPFRFPKDHGLHFVKSEWLYFTGVIKTDTGKELGYEMTIFQMGHVRWYLMDYAYVGHVAVSDPDAKKHYLGEFIAPLYSVKTDSSKPDVNIGNFTYLVNNPDGFTITADSNGIKLNLKLKSKQGVLLHGEDGGILMGDDRESAYYSFTDLATEGTIAYSGKEHKVVSGRTWMDHQWGNFTIPGMHWDWFSMRLDDGSALMIFNIRDKKDKPHRVEWTYRASDGAVRYGTSATITAARKWRDDAGKATYPMDWSISVKDLKANLTVKALFDTQSIHHVKTPSYWEGLCSVDGVINGKPVKGKNYTEMTFYND
jgi:predicted secreted hydrolase